MPGWGKLSVRELMCTISFAPTSGGFYLAMNRDEKRSRPVAVPPEIVSVGERRAILPRDPKGGTWVSVNDVGVCLALINWHGIERNPVGEIASRGKVTTSLASASSSSEITDRLMSLTLRRYRPFRIIGVIPSEQLVTEWRWNVEAVVNRTHAWQRQHWFSSGFDELRAEFERGRVCDAAHRKKREPSIASLRRLHQSHAPSRGPFSICMHRDDAVTVSYTEVEVSDLGVVMRYSNGSPCLMQPMITHTLPLCKVCPAVATNS